MRVLGFLLVCASLLAALAAGGPKDLPVRPCGPAPSAVTRRFVPPTGPERPETVTVPTSREAPPPPPPPPPPEPRDHPRPPPPDPVITGWITDEQGRPVQAYEIISRAMGRSRYRRTALGWAEEGPAGRFVFHLTTPWVLGPPGIDPDDWPIFRVRAEGYLGGRFVADRAQWKAIQEGRSIRGITVRMRRAARVEGYVFGPRGEPVLKATVTLEGVTPRESRRRTWIDLTDSDGRYEFDKVDPELRGGRIRADDGEGWASDPVPLSDALGPGETARFDPVLVPRDEVELEIRFRGWRDGYHAELDATDIEVEQSSFRTTAREGARLLEVSDEDREPLLRREFDIPRGQRIHRLEVSLPPD